MKFERFIFDALPLAGRWTMVETDRAGEFEPLKNAAGPDSPATVRQRMSDQFARLARAGRRDRPPPARRLGPVRHRDQPPVRPRCRGAEVEDRAGHGRRGAALSPLISTSGSSDFNTFASKHVHNARIAMLHAIIMAGGSGTRFWPKSRRNRPKQLLRLCGDATMLQQTVARIAPLVPPERIWIITGADQAEAVRAQLPDLPAGNVVAEPCPRDTAPCVGLAARDRRQDRPRRDDDRHAGRPRDRARRDVPQDRCRAAVAVIDDDPSVLVTFGIKPTRPETGYGYIERGESLEDRDGIAVHRVVQFREKPDRATAEQFLAAGTVRLELGDLRLARPDHPRRSWRAIARSSPPPSTAS